LNGLSSHPELARHVRELKLTLHERTSRRDATIVSAALMHAAPQLDALHTFSWDSPDVAPDENVWTALHTCCPQLVNVATTVEAAPAVMESNLLGLANLRSFSLVLGRGFYGTIQVPLTIAMSTNVLLVDIQSDSHLLWDMLIHRCPTLQSLSIKGANPVSFDDYLFARTRWPHLRSLTLSNIEIHYASSGTHPLLEFIDRHPDIQDLDVCRFALPAPHRLPGRRYEKEEREGDGGCAELESFWRECESGLRVALLWLVSLLVVSLVSLV
jgi:hypothetical protein